jgi:hypothetical protein
MCASGRIARHPRHCPVIASPQPLLKAIQQPVSRWFREHGGNPDGVKPQISSFALYGLAYRHGESDDSWTSPHVLESGSPARHRLAGGAQEAFCDPC